MPKLQDDQQITMYNTLLCSAEYCAHICFYLHLFNFPLLTCCGRLMLLSV